MTQGNLFLHDKLESSGVKRAAVQGKSEEELL